MTDAEEAVIFFVKATKCMSTKTAGHQAALDGVDASLAKFGFGK